MKKSSYIVFLTIFFLQIGKGPFIFSQQFTDELKTKLPKPDQYKLLKAATFNDKGKAFMAQGGNFSESQISDSVFYKNNEQQIEAYYDNRIKASYCFKTANGLLYNVLDKYIKDFWEKFKDDKKTLEMIIKVENEAYDSLIKADHLREMAEKELYIDAKIPLVSKAEAIENVALFRLEKILFTYMNWPEKPNVSWLLSADNGIPNTVALNENIQVKSNISGLGTTGNGSIQKASNIYSLMHISESQIDTFNEFLQKKYPGKIEAYLIDFQGLYEDVIDSLHKEWHQYLYSGNIAPDTIKSNLNLNKTPVASDKLTLNNATVSPNFLFKVQIAASRVQMSQQVLKGIYSGNEEIVESFEDKWFKYTIGQFMSYNDARNCRDRINVKGAFVIAYLNGKRMKIPLTL